MCEVGVASAPVRSTLADPTPLTTMDRRRATAPYCVGLSDPGWCSALPDLRSGAFFVMLSMTFGEAFSHAGVCVICWRPCWGNSSNTFSGPCWSFPAKSWGGRSTAVPTNTANITRCIHVTSFIAALQHRHSTVHRTMRDASTCEADG